MFRTFAISAADLLDPVKRAAFSKSLSDLERDCEKAKCGLVAAPLVALGDVLASVCHVKKLDRVQVAQGVWQEHPILRIDAEEFDKLVGNAGAGPAASDPRVLR